MEFHKRFELLDLVHDDGVKTFEAFDVQNASPVWVHTFDSEETAVLQELAALPENAREQIITQGMGESILQDNRTSGHYVVTHRLPETGLRPWLKSVVVELAVAIPAAQPTVSKGGRKRLASNTQETGRFSTMFDSSRAGSALASPDAPKQPGQFSRMFQTSSAPAPPPPSVLASQRKNAQEQGGFTRLFQPAKPVETVAKLSEEPVDAEVLPAQTLAGNPDSAVEALPLEPANVEPVDIEPIADGPVDGELRTLENTAVESTEAERSTVAHVADTADLHYPLEIASPVSDGEKSEGVEVAAPADPPISKPDDDRAIESSESIQDPTEKSSDSDGESAQAQADDFPVAAEIHAVADSPKTSIVSIQRANVAALTELQVISKRDDAESAVEPEHWLLKPEPPSRSNLALFLGLSAVLVLAIVIVMLVGARI